MSVLVRLSLGLRAEKQRIIKRLSKSHGALDVRTEEGNSELLGRDFPEPVGDAFNGAKGDPDDAVVVLENRRLVKENDWGARLSPDRANGLGLLGYIGHDGISRYWSRTLGCWVPVRESSPEWAQRTQILRTFRMIGWFFRRQRRNRAAALL